ncbi:MAG: glycosyltransferase family 4 protein [Microthrixaceae bacterium]
MSAVAVVAPSPVPFREGGAERLWGALANELRSRGWAVDLLKQPVRERTLAQLLAGYAAFAEWDLSHFDQVISGKYPAWAVDHPNHHLWMLHPLRGLYDRFPAGMASAMPRVIDPDLRFAAELPGRLAEGTPAAPVIFEIADRIEAATGRLGPDHPDLAIPSPFARALVTALDHGLLAGMRVSSHAAISAEVARRPAWFPPGAEARVLHPPLATEWARRLAAVERPERHDDEGLRVLSVGRLEQAKRHDLALAAVRAMTAPARLRIVGSGPDADRLAALTDADDRVEIVGGLSDDGLAAAYAWADVAIFCPDREDYGLVALEALTAGRAMVATSDSGGALELLRADDGPPAASPGAGTGTPTQANSLIVKPTANSLGSALDALATDPARVRRLGEAARSTAAELSWDTTIDGLLDPPRGPHRRGRDRPFVVALSTYPVAGRPQGGPLRAFHLLSGLADAGARVKVISLTTDPDRAGNRRLAPNLDEEAVLISGRQSAAEHKMRLVSTTHAITDIAASLLWPATPRLAGALRSNLADASAAVLIQPFLASALAALAPSGLPVIYDAHNHESTLKNELLGGTRGGRWLAAAATEAERAAVDLASAVIATTDADADLFERFDAVARARLHVIGNGAVVAGAAYTEGEQRSAIGRRLLQDLGLGDRQRLAVFVGSGHPPNIAAARHIIDALGRRSDVAVALIGRHSEMLGRRGLPRGVAALGRVDDETLASYLAGADVALNPIDEGSGSNLKLIDYFAAGVPVITSAVGARGVPDVRRFALVAAPGALGQALDTLWSDPGAPARARAARTWAEEHLDWTLLGKRFASTVMETIQAPRDVR